MCVPPVPPARLNRIRSSSSPEVFEPCRTQLSIPNRVLNVLMAQVRLQCPRVAPPICQRVTAGVAEHVRVNAELKLGLDASPRNYLGEARAGKWCPTLRCEHEERLAL